MFIESPGRQMQYVLVEGKPVKVEQGVALWELSEKLDLPNDCVGVYTDENGDHKVLPVHESIVENVPANTEILLEEEVSVEQPETIFSSASEPQNTEVVVEGNPIVVDEQTTAQELKELVGAEDRDALVFRDDETVRTVEDDKLVLDHVEPGTEFALQPVRDSHSFGGGIPA